MRYTKLQRYFLPPYNQLERVLVALNYYQNFYVMALFVNTPLLLRVAHEARCNARAGTATRPAAQRLALGALRAA